MTANTLRQSLQILQNNQWHPAMAILVILFFPLAIEYGYSDFIRESEINTRLGWFLIVLATVWVIRKPVVLHALGILFIIPGSLDVLYASTFGGIFTTASLEAAALTDTGEAMGFLRAYAGFENLGLLFLYIGTSTYFLRNSKILSKGDRGYKTVVALGSVMLLVAVYRMGYLSRYYDTIPGFMGVLPSYLKSTESIAKQIQERTHLVASTHPVLELDNAHKAQTYVFVIGEALTRTHMSVYGYQRDTTPHLEQMKNELTLFDNVISSHAQTQPSLRLALTQANTKNKLPMDQALSIVDMANKAGFKTWWISNQQPLRSTLSAIAEMADETQFISNDYHGVQVRRFDGFLLPYVENALKDSANKKAIFVHLMGSHLQYNNRYPKEFGIFRDENVHGYTPQLSHKEIDYINSYDNSVRYTDWVVSKILNALKAQSGLTGLMFFSDHGEEVFDSLDFVGHRPESVTHAMVEIPFITWTSAAYRNLRGDRMAAMKANRQRPFMLDNAFVAMSSFMGIRAKMLAARDNLLSPNYQTPTRIVYKKNYDTKLRRPSILLSKIH